MKKEFHTNIVTYMGLSDEQMKVQWIQCVGNCMHLNNREKETNITKIQFSLLKVLEVFKSSQSISLILTKLDIGWTLVVASNGILESWDRFECSHYVGWFRVEHGGATCTIVLVYLSIKLRESVSLGQYRDSVKQT